MRVANAVFINTLKYLYLIFYYLRIFHWLFSPTTIYCPKSPGFHCCCLEVICQSLSPLQAMCLLVLWWLLRVVFVSKYGFVPLSLLHLPFGSKYTNVGHSHYIIYTLYPTLHIFFLLCFITVSYFRPNLSLLILLSVFSNVLITIFTEFLTVLDIFFTKIF